MELVRLITIFAFLQPIVVFSQDFEEGIPLGASEDFYENHGIVVHFGQDTNYSLFGIDINITSMPIPIPPLKKDSIYDIVLELEMINFLDSMPMICIVNEKSVTVADGENLSGCGCFYSPHFKNDTIIFAHAQYHASGAENLIQLGILDQYHLFLKNREGILTNWDAFLNSSFLIKNFYFYKADPYLFVEDDWKGQKRILDAGQVFGKIKKVDYYELKNMACP